ncbi:MAG: hypothetical protein EOO99_11025 [Pedobacter sp.]|nr:MAG: hypothetical protein EOO99_11025 [Pedobacter sp.]
MNSSDWTIMLKQNDKGMSHFKESDAFKDIVPLIKSIKLVPNKYAEMLIYSSGIRVVGRLILDDYSKAIYLYNNFNFNDL